MCNTVAFSLSGLHLIGELSLPLGSFSVDMLLIVSGVSLIFHVFFSSIFFFFLA